jgi:hypothetical protein
VQVGRGTEGAGPRSVNAATHQRANPEGLRGARDVVPPLEPPTAAACFGDNPFGLVETTAVGGR